MEEGSVKLSADGVPTDPPLSPESVSDDQLMSPAVSDSDSDSDLDEPLDESLSTTIIQEIEDGSYVCLVCTCEIDRQSTIWSCQECYRVYDLDCIKDWAVRGSSTTANKQWRCPACNYEHTTIPSKFTCWCGRVRNPQPNSLIPFSCGNACESKYDDCIHACSSQCHPGQHPQCGALGPVMKCHCGKHSQQLPCLVTPYASGWACDVPCDVTVCALGHSCPDAECHSGFCRPCSRPVQAKCYCGKESLQIECSKLDPKPCNSPDGPYIGAAACANIHIQHYDCGIHFEKLACQPLGVEPPVCKFSPEVVTSCYCGKLPAQTLHREACTDPMPECDQVCDKLLACGCRCLAKCHPGPCECFNKLRTKCSCGTHTYTVPCKAIQAGFVPKCKHKCGALLSCRRHTHREECCEFEQVALKRARENKKHARKNTRMNFDEQLLTMEPIHICTKPCNLVRACGKHRCEALCHFGPCGVCLESSNDDLVCHCGKTVVPAPVRCGTQIQCTEPCIRPRPCGHKQEFHFCHGDDKECPKCTEPVSKKCKCGAKVVKNVLCSVDDVSCGKICTARKDCGHPCNRACSEECSRGIHAPLTACQSICRKVKSKCPHLCVAKCHVGKGLSCDAGVCKSPVVLHCECGRLSKETQCGASLESESAIGTFLSCNNDCAVAKREEDLRLAFNMGQTKNSAIYPEDVLQVYRRQKNWCLKYEKDISDFMSNYVDCVAAGISPTKTLHLAPMSKPQRAFIRNLALAYKIYSESQDAEPHRFVFLVITEQSAAPELSLREVADKEDEIEKKRQFLEELKESQIKESLFNLILIRDVFFGVSKEDVEKNVLTILEKHPEIENGAIHWMKESTYAFTCDNFKDMDKEKEDKLYMLLKTFKSVLRERYIAFDCKMCMVDEDVTVIFKTDNRNAQNLLEQADVAVPNNNGYSVLSI